MNDKIKAIIAHITFLGWLLALILNFVTRKTPLTSFYLRQTLGIFLAGMLVNMLPFRGLAVLLSLGLLALLIYSLIGAIKEEQRELPIVGRYFQEWFSFL